MYNRILKLYRRQNINVEMIYLSIDAKLYRRQNLIVEMIYLSIDAKLYRRQNIIVEMIYLSKHNSGGEKYNNYRKRKTQVLAGKIQ